MLIELPLQLLGWCQLVLIGDKKVIAIYQLWSDEVFVCLSWNQYVALFGLIGLFGRRSLLYLGWPAGLVCFFMVTDVLLVFRDISLFIPSHLLLKGASLSILMLHQGKLLEDLVLWLILSPWINMWNACLPLSVLNPPILEWWSLFLRLLRQLLLLIWIPKSPLPPDHVLNVLIPIF